MGEFRSLCIREKMHELKWPQRDYIIQVARFDPSKGFFFSFNIFSFSWHGQAFRTSLIPMPSYGPSCWRGRATSPQRSTLSFWSADTELSMTLMLASSTTKSCNLSGVISTNTLLVTLSSCDYRRATSVSHLVFGS